MIVSLHVQDSFMTIKFVHYETITNRIPKIYLYFYSILLVISVDHYL